MAVASIGKPIAILNFSIHAPGLGKNLSQAGCQLSSTYGKARPNPTVSNTATMTRGVCAKANPRAMLRNGAVQGVAKIVASTPLKNAPAAPCLDARLPAAPMICPPRLTSKTPNRFNATSATRTVRVCDGRLTIDSIGGTNTKINYVDVAPVSLGQ